MANESNINLPEIVENILGHVEDNTTVLNARLVHSIWKSEMDKLMNKNCTSSWMEWKPSRSFSVPSFGSFLRTYMVKKNDNDVLDDYIYYPFPSKSLNLLVYREKENVEKLGWMCMSKQDFWIKHGPQIINLALDGVVVLQQIHWFLTHSPNLHGLRITNLVYSQSHDRDRENRSPPPPLPNLQHIEIWKYFPCHYGPVSDFDRPSTYAINWILSTYASNLVSLKLDCSLIHLLRADLKFKNLTFLKLRHPSIPFYDSITATSMPKLAHLSILEVGFDQPDDKLIAIIDCIERLANNLVKLHLDVDFQQFRRSLDAIKLSEQIFPKLKVFATNYPVEPEESALIKEGFLPRFPALRKLQFLQHPNPEDEVPDWWVVKVLKYFLRKVWLIAGNDENTVLKKYVEKEDYWKCAPTLQTISVHSFHEEPNPDQFDILTINRLDN